MNADLLTLIWVQSAILLGLAWVACRIAKAPAVRQWVCRGALLGAVVLALGAPLGSLRKTPAAQLPFKPIVLHLPQPAVSLAVRDRPISVPANRQVVAREPRAPAIAGRPDGRGTNWAVCFAVAWALGSLMLTLEAGIGLVLLLLLRLRSKPCMDRRVLATAEICLRKVRLRTLELRLRDGDGQPFVAGVFRPVLYITAAWVSGLSDQCMEAFLCHEAAHVARHDVGWSAFYRLARIALWPQPFVWLVAAPMNLAAEELCDRSVIDAGAEPATYADGLLRLVESGAGEAHLVRYGFGIAHSKGAVAKRLEAIMAGAGTRTPFWTKFTLLASMCVVMALSAVVFAVPHGVSPAPSPPKLQRPTSNGWLPGRPAPMSGPSHGSHPAFERIRVVNADGNPLPRGRAWVIYSPDDPKKLVREVAIRKGAMRVDFRGYDGTVIVLVEAPGCGLTFERRAPGVRPVADLVMRRPAQVKGRLLTPEGRPAAGVNICAEAIWDGPARGPNAPELEIVNGWVGPQLWSRFRAVTDRNGDYSIGGLPRRARVELCPERLSDVQPADVSQLEIGDGEVTMARAMRLTWIGAIDGRVTMDGKPVAGAQVECLTPGSRTSTATAPDGSYDFPRLPVGRYVIALDLTPPLGERATARAYEGVDLHRGERKNGLDFALVPGAVVKGRLTYADGRAASDLEVAVRGPAHPDNMGGAPDLDWTQTAKTDRDGRYAVRVPPGKQRIYVPMYPFRGRYVTVRDGEVRVLDFEVP